MLIKINPTCSNFTHCKHPVYRANSQYGEKQEFMVEHTWAFSQDTAIYFVFLLAYLYLPYTLGNIGWQLTPSD